MIKRWWPTILCVAVILYATLSADPTAGAELPLFPGFDKLVHAVMFGGLAGAVAFDWQRSHRATFLDRRRMTVICALCVVAGGADELAQWADFLADIIGIAVAWVAAPPAIRRVLGLQ